MIELKNATKIYKAKKGSSTIALDNMNLKIGNKGMVFIVGKSGSGKSTLLNLLGGLDGITSGEMLIHGKNITEFSRKQYDSYRNTYVGFIFQDFNVLEQYNVYENIELALKLQNKKVDRQKLDDLLEELGLQSLGNRKINELSGGQKQRVAIARALIKKPQIILADEPTGNLDRSSSEQIFEILKSISRDQLVIVVSHDIESAHKYADRIISISDGKIIEDSNELGEIEKANFELKKSSLPFAYAFKMSLISFKNKPIKLFMAIFLTTIALIFMGITVNFALFDKEMFITNTMRDNNDYNYELMKVELIPGNGSKKLELTEEDLDHLEKIVGNKINPSYILFNNQRYLAFEFGDNPDDDQQNSYWHNSLFYSNFVEIRDSRILGNLIGREPNSSNEIVVHKYFLEYAMKFGIMTVENELYYPTSCEEFLSSKKELKLGKNAVIVTGVIDDDDTLFQEARKKGVFDDEKLQSYWKETYANTSIYTKGFVDHAILESDNTSFLETVKIEKSSDNYVKGDFHFLSNKISIITNDGVKEIGNLGKKEVILSLDSIKEMDKQFDSKLNKYIESKNGGIYSELLREFLILYLKQNSDTMNLTLIARNFYTDLNIKEEVSLTGISLGKINYISQQYEKEYIPVLKKLYTVRVYDDNIEGLRKIFKKLMYYGIIDGGEEELPTGIHYVYNTSNANNVSYVIATYDYFKIFILIISLVFVVFSLLLFSNFIFSSISYCKKEIGILRALGATNMDIIKIFGYESVIIAIFSWIFSIGGWVYVCDLLNHSLFDSGYYVINAIVLHPLIPVIMFIYTIAIAICVTIISTSRISNIKPIDAILNK